MDNKTLDILKQWFADYVSAYYTGDTEYDYPIQLKEVHTENVCKNMLVLGNDLDLSDSDLILAEVIGLFHDVGRFEQYKTYGTFNDMASENHARLGLREMARHGVLSSCDKAEKRLISKAIGYHNAPFLTGGHDTRDDLFMRMIRDADKLDVWQILIGYYGERKERPSSAIELDFPDDPVCSSEIIDALHMKRTALMKDARTVSDVMLLQISWVFDLNFSSSFRMVQDRQYIQNLRSFLPQSKSVQKAVDQAGKYVMEMSDGP